MEDDEAQSPRCEICGAVPAHRVKFRSLVGLVIAFKLTTHERVLCRSCGLYLYRHQMNETLMKGWWGFFAFFVNLWVIVANHRAGKVVEAWGEPTDPQRPEGPTDPGPLLRKRTGAIVTGVLFVALAVLFAVGALTEEEETIDVTTLPGQCVNYTGPDGGIDVVECSGAHDAQVVNVVDDPAKCSTNAEATLSLDMVVGEDRFACLDEN